MRDNEKAVEARSSYPEIPNEETLAAFEEIEEMKRHPERYKGYTDVEEMMRELLSDEEPNEETIEAIRETEDIISGKVKTKTYRSAKELFDDMNGTRSDLS